MQIGKHFWLGQLSKRISKLNKMGFASGNTWMWIQLNHGPAAEIILLLEWPSDPITLSISSRPNTPCGFPFHWSLISLGSFQTTSFLPSFPLFFYLFHPECFLHCFTILHYLKIPNSSPFDKYNVEYLWRCFFSSFSLDYF